MAGEYSLKAKRYGVENVNSTKQVSSALVAMGEDLSARTPSGGLKVDADVLLQLADLDREWHPRETRKPNPLATAVLHAKRSGKWAGTYADAFAKLRDENDRIHPSIGGLQARTARMSVSRPPLQQLPSSDATIRRCFIADPGMSMISVDYSQIEMRVLAALSEEPALIADILSGNDLHDQAASRVFGDNFSKAQRKLAKIVGFSNVFGGGVATIVKQTGADRDRAKAAVDTYNRLYPGIKKYGRQLQRAAEFGKTEIVTPSGRHLPLDKDRLYSATNYIVQSTARDIMAQAIVDLFDAGLGDHVLLPIHDEILGQAPIAEAEEVAHAIEEAMNTEFFDLPIISEPEVLGPHWKP
jgi:DNA polymerase-1